MASLFCAADGIINSLTDLFAERRQHLDQPIHRAFINPAFNGFRYSTCLFAVDISDTGYWRSLKLSSKNAGIADWLTG